MPDDAVVRAADAAAKYELQEDARRFAEQSVDASDDTEEVDDDA